MQWHLVSHLILHPKATVTSHLAFSFPPDCPGLVGLPSHLSTLWLLERPLLAEADIVTPLPSASCPTTPTHSCMQCAADSTHCGCTRTPEQKNKLSSENSAACQGCECGRQSWPWMIRPLALEAKDPGDGVRIGRYGMWSREGSFMASRMGTGFRAEFVSTVGMRAQS